MSSNGQNCSILSQNVPKFELYKHNDELFNIFLAWQPSWLEVGINGHTFGRGPSKNHFSKIWLIWPLLLKIEMSSNGQNCSILSQNVPKFELYNPPFFYF
jgi:hypothetical protein